MSARILVINPNSDARCTAGIAAAVAPFARPGLAHFDTLRLPDGPPAIATWADWHAVTPLLAALVAREPAAAYVIACVSDPGIDLLRSQTRAPVLGALRCGVAAALARAERFGLVAFVEASKQRQRRVLQAMGVEGRLAGQVALDLPMATLLDPQAPRARLAEVGRQLAGMGAEVLVLGCAGLAAHRGYLEATIGLPVIEPIAAAAAAAVLAVS